VFETGYLTLLRWRGVPVRFHWTAPLGALFFGGLSFIPGFWVGFLLLILIHEMGHALLVRRVGLRAVSIDVHGLGGQCRFAGYPDPLQLSIVAWGGVLAQAVLGIATLLVVYLVGPPQSSFFVTMVHAFTITNLWIGALNLLPFRPLDGAEAWKLFGLLRRRPRGPRRERKRRSKVDAARGVAVVDDGEVKETIREALERAQRDAADKRRQKN
jgi:Zn-dependent protease